MFVVVVSLRGCYCLWLHFIVVLCCLQLNADAIPKLSEKAANLRLEQEALDAEKKKKIMRKKSVKKMSDAEIMTALSECPTVLIG